MMADKWLIILQSLFEHRDTCWIPGVSQSNSHVPKIASPPGALNWTVLELAVEPLRREKHVLSQIRACQVGMERQAVFILILPKPVPWANHLAYIAAKNPFAHPWTKARRYFSLVFDG